MHDMLYHITVTGRVLNNSITISTPIERAHHVVHHVLCWRKMADEGKTSGNTTPDIGIGSDSDNDDEEFVDETIVERIVGLTEMVPDKYWSISGRFMHKAYSILRSGAWIVASSAALIIIPPLIEYQRVEMEEAEKQQSKQLLFGQGAGSGQPPPLMGSGLGGSVAGVPAPPPPTT